MKGTETESNMVFMTIEGAAKPKSFVDSQLSCLYSDKERFNVKNIKELLKIGDGKLVYAMKVGKLQVFYRAEAKKQVTFILDNVQYIPNFWVNLFSLTVVIAKGCTITNKDKPSTSRKIA